jgi:hypothetical protein
MFIGLAAVMANIALYESIVRAPYVYDVRRMAFDIDTLDGTDLITDVTDCSVLLISSEEKS